MTEEGDGFAIALFAINLLANWYDMRKKTLLVQLILTLYLSATCSLAQPPMKTLHLCVDADVMGRWKGKWYLLAAEKVIQHGTVLDSCTRLNVPVTGRYVLSVMLPGRLTRRISFLADTVRAGHVFRLRNEDWTEQLQEVVVQGGSRFSQQGDTLVVNTEGVETRPFGDATELFDNIAGLQVRGDGSVWIMGKRVARLDVDGRALFGGDPTATLTMLRADMIASLRVVEQLANDGKSTLSVSAQLRKDRKTGQYGELGGALGAARRYDLAARYNLLSPGTALNGFLTANSINRRGLAMADFMRYTFNEHMNQLTGVSSVVQAMTKNGVDSQPSGNSPSLSDWTGEAVGITRVLSSGLNVSHATKRSEWLGYVMGAQHNRTLEQVQEAVTYLPPYLQRSHQRGQQRSTPAQLLSSLMGRWRPNSTSVWALKNTLYLHRDTQQQLSQQQIRLLPDSSNSILNETYHTQQSGQTNQFQLAWSKRGKHGGANTSVYAYHTYENRQVADSNRITRLPAEQYETLRQQQTGQQVAGLQAIKSWPLSKRWLLEARGNLIYQYYKAITTAHFPNQTITDLSRTSGRFALQNWLTQSDLYALYRHNKLTATAGVAAWTWLSHRRSEGQTQRLTESRLLPTAAIVYNSSRNVKYVLRTGFDIEQPSLPQLNPVVDSSRLQRISAGQFNLSISPRQFVQTDIHLDKLLPNISINLGVTLSKIVAPVLTDVTTLGAGLIRSVPIQLPLSAHDVTATLTVIRISMQSPIQWFMFNTYLQRDTYQIVNELISPNRLQLFTNQQHVQWRVRQGVKLDLNWNTIATSINRQPINWQYKVKLRSDLKFSGRLYAQPTVDYWLSNSLGRQNSFLQINLHADFYALKNKGLRITARALNLLDQRNQVNNVQTGNGIVVTEQSILPQTLMLGITFFPEKWL